MTVRNIRSISECNFTQLMERFQKFQLPIFQRVYSWEEENWNEFLQTVKDLIEENKLEKGKNIHFIGSIILQEKKENEVCDVIDGQQRLITLSILLSVLFRKFSEKEGLTPKEDYAKQIIKDFCLINKTKLRIEPHNKLDRKGLETIIRHNLGQTTDEAYNLNKTKIEAGERWFNKELSNNEFDYFAIYDQLLNRFHFSLVILGSEVKPWDLFMALNNTGLNLNVSDLLKSLVISKLETEEDQERASEKWDREIVEKVCGSDNTKINLLLPQFLLDFWWATYGKTGDTKLKKGVVASKSNLYSLFENKFKKVSGQEVEELLNQLAKHAEIYRKIIKPRENVDWWKSNWPPEMFYIIFDISTLSFKQLFPIILSATYRFGKNKELKPAIVNKIKKLFFYMFRYVTIRKGYPRIVSNEIIFPTLDETRKGEKEFLEDNELLKKEFTKEKDQEFYQSLKEYELDSNSICRFILRSYYWEKLTREEKGLGKILGLGIKDDLLRYEAEHIIAKNPRQRPADYQKFDSVINSLGNYTLLTSKDNKRFADKLWLEKKDWIKKLGNDCLLNVLEEEKSFVEKNRLEETDIEERKIRIIKEIEKFELFTPKKTRNNSF